jgi:nitrate reductase delta subunit
VIPAPETLRLLADALAYPGPPLADDAARCAGRLAATHPAAAERLARFAAFARSSRLAELEEGYTAAFELSPVCSPYVGDQLFGASAERSLLLAGLRELQADAGLEGGRELPDHVCEVLRLAAADLPADVRGDLVRDGLAPAAKKMCAALEAVGHPWADVLGAVAEAVAVEDAPPVRSNPLPVMESTP